MFLDICEFHKKCAWHMTWYGATIVNHKLLEDVEWNYLEDKYLKEDSINFSQIGFYFEQIYKIRDNFSALHISTDCFEMRVSSLKKQSGWYKDTFKVWCECWVSAMKKLPELYEKETSIRRLGVYGEVFTWSSLISLRVAGIYNFRIFFKYLYVWNKVTFENILLIFISSILPKDIAKLYSKEYKIEKKIRKLFDCIQKNFEKVWIYGCGYNSLPFVDYIENSNLKLQGYIVSNKQYELDMHGKYKVVQYSENIFDDPDVAIIICTGEKIRNEILSNIPDRVRNRVFYI